MADIDRTKLAFMVAAALQRDGLSLRQAQDRHRGVTAGTLSRIGSGIDVSAANFLAVCKGLKLDPFEFLDLGSEHPKNRFGVAHRERKHPLDQAVAVLSSRETISGPKP